MTPGAHLREAFVTDNAILVGIGEQRLQLPLNVANRHGLVAGATGTGKTVTLQSIAEGFARSGVPVFMADVKGDLSGIGRPGGDKPKVAERARQLGVDHSPDAPPVAYWDVFGEQGQPLRATVSDFGPLLMARLLGLNETQQGVMELVFRLADEQGLLLLDLKDLRALLAHVGQNAKALTLEYGNVSGASVGAIQRSLLALETQGGDRLFGEPALELADLMRLQDGRGVVNVLAADRLIRSPRLYAGVLLWLLAELFEELPEVGDLDRPRLAFFFDEAHLLFEDAPPALTDQVESVVRLIRSKGVGVYFVTQSPLDIPDPVLGQLGHRVQHALRAFTPRDQKAVKAVAETFRPNPAIDAARAVQELGVGEALVSLLDAGGVPGIVQRASIVPPRSRLGPVTPAERAEAMAAGPLAGRYDRPVDRDSAYEMLARRADSATPKEAGAAAPKGSKAEPQPSAATNEMLGAAAKSLARSLASGVGNRLGRELVRGLLGALARR
jgi:DNA helicase HerA-like ATPase